MTTLRQLLTNLGDVKSRIKEGYNDMSEQKKDKVYNDIMALMVVVSK